MTGLKSDKLSLISLLIRAVSIYCLRLYFTCYSTSYSGSSGSIAIYALSPYSAIRKFQKL
jgi:hypothetical protein